MNTRTFNELRMLGGFGMAFGVPEENRAAFHEAMTAVIRLNDGWVEEDEHKGIFASHEPDFPAAAELLVSSLKDFGAAD